VPGDTAQPGKKPASFVVEGVQRPDCRQPGIVPNVRRVYTRIVNKMRNEGIEHVGISVIKFRQRGLIARHGTPNQGAIIF
jgi:hypothetical protein